MGVLTHIRHDEPFPPAGSVSTPERETPGDSPLKTSSPSHPQPNKQCQFSAGSGKDPRFQGSSQGGWLASEFPNTQAGNRDAWQLTNPQDPSPTGRRKRRLLFRLTARATCGVSHRAKWLQLPGFLGCLVLWTATSGTTSRTGSSKSRSHMICDLFCAPGSTSQDSDAGWLGISGAVLRQGSAHLRDKPRPTQRGCSLRPCGVPAVPDLCTWVELALLWERGTLKISQKTQARKRICLGRVHKFHYFFLRVRYLKTSSCRWINLKGVVLHTEQQAPGPSVSDRNLIILSLPVGATLVLWLVWIESRILELSGDLLCVYIKLLHMQTWSNFLSLALCLEDRTFKDCL